MLRTDIYPLRNLIGGECADVVCRCWYTKYGWAHQFWCENIWLKEITCENCQYYDRQSGCCSHPARRRGQLNRSADNGNQKNANEKLLVRSDRLNEKN